MILDKYQQRCKEIVVKNHKAILETDDQDEKARLVSLNGSMIQRLKKRRKEQHDQDIENKQKQKIDVLVSTFEQLISSDEKKQFLKQLQQKNEDLDFSDTDSDISSMEFK